MKQDDSEIKWITVGFDTRESFGEGTIHSLRGVICYRDEKIDRVFLQVQNFAIKKVNIYVSNFVSLEKELLKYIGIATDEQENVSLFRNKTFYVDSRDVCVEYPCDKAGRFKKDGEYKVVLNAYFSGMNDYVALLAAKVARKQGWKLL